MRRTLLLTVLVGISMATLVLGAVPRLINYQGVLTDGAGTPVPDNSYSITFNLYHQESGGSPLWTQTSPVTVTGGIFNVALGEIPFEYFEHPVFLGLSIAGGQELIPRRALLASPYALNASTVQDSSIHAFKIADGNVVRSLNGKTDQVNLLPGSNVTITPTGNDLTISASGGSGGVGGSGSAGQVAFWNDPTTLSGDNDLFWDDTNKRLGVGTPNPNGRMRVESSEQYTAVIAGDNVNAGTQVVRVNFTGTGDADVTGIFAQAKPNDGYGFGGDFVGGNIGVRAFANIGTQVKNSYGIHAKAIGDGGISRYGVLAEASGPGATMCYGVYAQGSSATSTYTIGVYAEGLAGDYRYGVYGYADAGGNAYYGVVGEGGTEENSGAVYALGDLVYTGSLVGPPSDARLKEDIRPYQGALASIKQIEPKTFRYKTGDPAYEDINMAPGLHYGLIAQDLEKVLPELVVEKVHAKSPGKNDPREPLKVKGIKYMELIPILVQAIKEQQVTIETQKDNIDDLMARVAELEKK